MIQRGLHVAAIMDGNGRWATARGLPRRAGHRAGARAVRRVVEGAPALGIGELTLFAFSSDNWQRPLTETSALLRLLEGYLRGEAPRCVAEGVRVRMIGRRDRLPAGLSAAIAGVESATATGTHLALNIAIDYSSRRAMELGERVRDVDLLIRTGGEQRLSDFLLWECAWAEFWFTPVRWPDFGVAELAAAVREYGCRERRFGGPPAAAGPAVPGVSA
jgi:undecaprenyl diphosphate synthase